MIQLTCRNCGSTDVIREKDLFRCQSCGAAFILEKHEQDERAKIEEYREKMLECLMVEDDFEFDWEKADKYRRKILELDPDDPYAWAGQVVLLISKGIIHHADEIIDAGIREMESVMAKGSEEEIKDIKDHLALNFRTYGSRMLRYAPDRRVDLESIFMWAMPYADPDVWLESEDDDDE